MAKTSKARTRRASARTGLQGMIGKVKWQGEVQGQG